MILKYFKLSFSIRLRRRPALHPSRRSLSYVLQVTLLPSTLLRNYTSVKLHVKHQCNPKNNPIDKTKKSLAKQRRLCICIDFSLHDFSQLLRRKPIKTHCQISHSQRKSDNLPRRVAYRNAYYAAVSFEIIQIVSSVTALHHVRSIQLF